MASDGAYMRAPTKRVSLLSASTRPMMPPVRLFNSV